MSDVADLIEAPPVYDLFSGVGPARGRLVNLEPTLQRINDRFVRHLRTALLQYLRRAVTITTNGVRMIEHRELMEALGSPTYLTLFTMRPLRGTIVLMFDVPLVISLVESRFGGSGRFPITVDRDFTAFELKSMRRVVETALDQLVVAWEPLGHFEIGALRHETNPQFAGFAHADELIMASSFEVTVDQAKGMIATYIPYAAVEPLQDQLAAGLVADAGGNEGHWSETLQRGVQQASITLNVELGKISISVGDLVSLSPGAVFEIDQQQCLVVEANGVPLFRGRWGQHGHKLGILVEERLPPLTPENLRPLRRSFGREDG